MPSPTSHALTRRRPPVFFRLAERNVAPTLDGVGCLAVGLDGGRLASAPRSAARDGGPAPARPRGIPLPRRGRRRPVRRPGRLPAPPGRLLLGRPGRPGPPGRDGGPHRPGRGGAVRVGPRGGVAGAEPPAA